MTLLLLLLCLCFDLDLTYSYDIYNGGVVTDGLALDNSDDDPHCLHHVHKFYRQMKCQPEFTPHAKCPTSYKCATLLNRSPDMCYYAGRRYPVGFNLTKNMADFHTPCIQSCQCVRMYEGARFYCTRPVDQLCPTPPGCRHFPFLEDFPCCQRGLTTCNKGKQDSVKCVYGGRSYSEGERFFPSDDITCTQCICAAGFNGTVASPYCHQPSCALELWGDTPVMLTRGCIPVYLGQNGCCPFTFRCPKPSDRVVKTEKKTSYPNKADKKCQFGHLTMNVGDQLTAWAETGAKEVECACRVPPLASCVRRNFTLTDEVRREFAQDVFQPQDINQAYSRTSV